MNRKPNILLGVTGSVAATLTPKLAAELEEIGEVRVIATEAALYFFGTDQVGVRVWTDQDEWPRQRYAKDQDIPHISLGDWADVLVIAPLTANTLAKLVLGLADNLLTNVYRAWPDDKPVVVAPAMNTRMWQKRLTREQMKKLQCDVVTPVSKKLACGTTGVGAMADIQDIVEKTRCVLRRGMPP